jgi:hypothetical protein
VWGMKKILLMVLIIASFTLTGCEAYPYIEYHNSCYALDHKNRQIEILNGYEMEQGNSYEWVETENGYDLIIHFAKEGEQK